MRHRSEAPCQKTACPGAWPVAVRVVAQRNTAISRAREHICAYVDNIAAPMTLNAHGLIERDAPAACACLVYDSPQSTFVDVCSCLVIGDENAGMINHSNCLHG